MILFYGCTLWVNKVVLNTFLHSYLFHLHRTMCICKYVHMCVHVCMHMCMCLCVHACVWGELIFLKADLVSVSMWWPLCSVCLCEHRLKPTRLYGSNFLSFFILIYSVVTLNLWSLTLQWCSEPLVFYITNPPEKLRYVSVWQSILAVLTEIAFHVWVLECSKPCWDGWGYKDCYW